MRRHRSGQTLGLAPQVGRAAARREAALWAGLCTGDREAFAAIYDNHSGWAYTLALRICGTPQVAEDAVSEAFVALWRHPQAFDPAHDRFAAWFRVLVHQASLDALTRHAPRTAASSGQRTAGGDDGRDQRGRVPGQ